MTTLETLETKSRLRVYETLEISIRNKTYSDWIDISDYLLDSTSTEIESVIDFDSYGYGEVKTSTATFILNNKDGYFNDNQDMYSVFSNSESRHYTKVRYKAGYIDNGIIDELVFYGLLNEKTSETDVVNGRYQFVALSLSQILSEQSIPSGILNASMTVSQAVNAIVNRTDITQYITYDAGNVNPDYDLTFDDATVFNNRKISEVLTDICQKCNSIWYVDMNGDFILESRTPNTNTPFLFTGGSKGTIKCNILSIMSYDAGFKKIINQVKYGNTVVDGNYLSTFGTNTFNLDGDDITTEATKLEIANRIITEHEVPKRRVSLKTAYMPNVISIKDRCIIDYKPSLKKTSKPILTFNVGESFNDSLYFGVYENRLILLPDRYYTYYGYKHNIKEGFTQHYLVEGEIIGSKVGGLVFNLGKFNNGEYFNIN